MAENITWAYQPSQCGGNELFWQGGEPPFRVEFYSQSGSSEFRSEHIADQVWGFSYNWTVAVPAGDSLWVAIVDHDGQYRQPGDPATVLSNLYGDDSCLEGDDLPPSNGLDFGTGAAIGTIVLLAVSLFLNFWMAWRLFRHHRRHRNDRYERSTYIRTDSLDPFRDPASPYSQNTSSPFSRAGDTTLVEKYIKDSSPTRTSSVRSSYPLNAAAAAANDETATQSEDHYYPSSVGTRSVAGTITSRHTTPPRTATRYHLVDAAIPRVALIRPLNGSNASNSMYSQSLGSESSSGGYEDSERPGTRSSMNDWERTSTISTVEEESMTPRQNHFLR